MTRTINITRSLREENDSGITGSEAVEVQNNQTPSQTISAGVEEEVAFGAFKDHQLRSLSLLSDQDVAAQFLGVRYAILATAAAAPDTVTHTGDLEQEIFSGDIIRLEGTVADDGEYEVASVTEAAGTTTIILTDGNLLPAGGGGAVGTLARICSVHEISYGYTVATVTLATGVITYTGNLTDIFAVDDLLHMTGSTGNDGIWLITAVTYAAPTTSITVVDVNDAGALPDNTDDGEISLLRTAFALPATVPLLWSLEGGMPNPFMRPMQASGTPLLFNEFRGDVIHCMVNNAGAVNAVFRGEIGINAIL
jgi:hypothetical protein